MPELPEVETVARQLAPLLCGRRVRRIEILDPRLGTVDARRIRGRRIRAVSRLGKQVALELAGRKAGDGTLWLAFHLRMTGRLVFDGAAETNGSKHLRAVLVLDRGSLFFLDARRFGVLRLCRSPEEVAPTGLDPLSDGFIPRALAALLAGSGQEIKPWLLRQDRLAGIGNIYASEILFAARIHPRRRAGSLSPAEARRLCASARRVLRRAVEHGGTTFSDFRDADGRTGSFQKFLAVYGREGEGCRRRCRGRIERAAQHGRSTFFCPRCQRDGAGMGGRGSRRAARGGNKIRLGRTLALPSSPLPRRRTKAQKSAR